MFGRMKQNFREKTGRATATKLPPNLEREMNYYGEWEKKNKKMSKAINEVIETFEKCKKRKELCTSLEEIERPFDGPVADGARTLREFLIARMATEKEAYEKARSETFANAELKAVLATSNALKKKRLNRDSAECDYENKQTEDKKAKFDCAEAEFQSALKQVEAYSPKIAEWDAKHKDNYVEAMQGLAEAFSIDAGACAKKTGGKKKKKH